MRTSLFLVWIGGFLIGLSSGLYINDEDTGVTCMSMYETPEDISECLWILNYSEQ